MTTKTNYDKSSTGTDIECTVFRDIDKGRMDFDENIEIVQHDGYSTTSIGYYIDNGNVEGKDAVKFTVKGTRAAREKYFIDNWRYYNAEEVKTWDDDTLDTEILGNEEDVNLINYALDRLPKVDGLEFVPNKNLIVFETRGYCQGDYAKVIYCPEDLEKEWGTYPKQESIEKMCHHYYWDAPFYATVTINGEEYNYWDMPEYDEYEWERDKFIAYVAKESGVAAEAIAPLLPAHPDYQ